MDKRKITESDIVDELLGQVSSPMEEAIQAARADADFDQAYDEWTRILAVSKSEAQEVEATTQRVRENVMESIRQERSFQAASAPQRGGFRGGWLSGYGWRKALLPLAPTLAVCLLVAIAAPQFFQSEISIPSKTEIVYVDFSIGVAKEGGSQDLPFNTLAEAVHATVEGGTIVIRPVTTGVTLSESIRIAKPLRLTAQSAEVGDGAD